MKKFFTQVILGLGIAIATYGAGYLGAKMLFHLNFTTKVVNPVQMQGKEFELANKLDRVVQLTAENAEETAGRVGGTIALITVGSASLSEAIASSLRSNARLRSRYQSLLDRVASMKKAYHANDMDGFTTIATTIVRESDDDAAS